MRGYCERHPWAIDVTLIVIVTAAAAALRLTLLGESRTASTRTSAARHGRAQDHGRPPDRCTRTPRSASRRALVRHAAVDLAAGRYGVRAAAAAGARRPRGGPAAYLLVRVAYARAEAFFASALLAVSYWHLLYSRVAHWSISYGRCCWRRCSSWRSACGSRRRAWFAASGVSSGSASTPTTSIRSPSSRSRRPWRCSRSSRYRGDEWRWWRSSVAMTFGVRFSWRCR